MTANEAAAQGLGNVALIVRRTIRAEAARVFEAWTRPEHLRRWWGPRNVECTAAEVELRVGGRYRLANKFPDGRIVWISGEFEEIERPHKLVYTWHLGSETAPVERVTVRFQSLPAGTEVIVIHERIPDVRTRAGHEQGWQGCLEGLVRLLGKKQ